MAILYSTWSWFYIVWFISVLVRMCYSCDLMINFSDINVT